MSGFCGVTVSSSLSQSGSSETHSSATFVCSAVVALPSILTLYVMVTAGSPLLSVPRFQVRVRPSTDTVGCDGEALPATKVCPTGSVSSMTALWTGPFTTSTLIV